MNEPGKRTLNCETISDEFANKLIRDCVSNARDQGKNFSIAICDPGGNLKAFLRMDGAPQISVSIAQDKAYTAASLGIATHALHEFIKGDPPLATGLVHVPRVITFGGGFPIVDDGKLIGGIGVSGGHYSEDMECASRALEQNNLGSTQ